MSTLTSSPSPIASPAHAFHIHSRSPGLSGHQHSRQRSSGPAAFRNPPSPAAINRASAAASRHSTSGNIGKGRYTQQSHSPSPSPSNATVGLSVTTSAPRDYKEEYRSVIEPEAVQPSYVSTGTQYSPDGFPPTARAVPGNYKQTGKGKDTAVDQSATKVVDTVASLQGEQSNILEKAPRQQGRSTPAAQQTPGSAGIKRKGGAGGGDSPQMSSTALAESSASLTNSSSNATTHATPSEPVLRVRPRQIQSESTAPPHAATSQSRPHIASNNDASLEDQPLSAEAAVRSTTAAIPSSSVSKRPRPHPSSMKLMPLEYSTCNPKDLGQLVSTMLNELITLNDRIPLSSTRLTRFHSRAPPSISVFDYLQRLIQHATLSPPILLSMVFYIDRLCGLYPAFTINSLTVHRFLITAGTVASKGLSDSFWTNPTYARIGGIPVGELASLELEFLRRVEWRIVPNPETLVEYYYSLVERTDGFELEGKAEGDDSDESDSIGSDAMSTTTDANTTATSATAHGEREGEQRDRVNEPEGRPPEGETERMDEGSDR